MEHQPESRQSISTWMRVIAAILAVLILFLVIGRLYLIWRTGSFGAIYELTWALVLCPIFGFVAITGRAPRWSPWGDLSKPVTLNSLTSSGLDRSTRKIRFRSIKATSLFRLVLIGVSTWIIPSFLYFGFLAVFGSETVKINDEAVIGPKGLLVAALMAMVFTVILSLAGWLGAYIGIRAWGRYKPLTLEYIPADDDGVQHDTPVDAKKAERLYQRGELGAEADRDAL